MAAQPGSATQDTGIAVLTASARAGEPDRYLAALLAPADRREDLLALAAFAGELARIPHLVTREPMMGEVRLQWWRDALGQAQEQVTGHPIADALRAAALRHDLPGHALAGMIDAQMLHLRDEPLADDAAFSEYLWKTEGAQFALAGRVLGAATTPDSDAAATSAGAAYGLTRVLLGVSRALSHGRLPLPLTQLAAAGVTPEMLMSGEGDTQVGALFASLRAQARRSLVIARQHVAKLPRAERVTFLPLALVEPYLRTVERSGHDLLREAAGLAPLTRVWRIAAAHWFGRL